jgi:uncharacterized protein with FMN-binding domain
MRKKVIFAIAAVVVLPAVVMGAGIIHSVLSVKNMEISEVDISSLPDGVYRGREDYLGFACKAEVTVSGHRIEDVRLSEDRTDAWVEKAKGVGTEVVKKQSLKVDAITGATITSKAMLKAIEKALKGQASGGKGE